MVPSSEEVQTKICFLVFSIGKAGDECRSKEVPSETQAYLSSSARAMESRPVPLKEQVHNDIRSLPQNGNKYTDSFTEDILLWIKCHNWLIFWCEYLISMQSCSTLFRGGPWSADWPVHLSLNDRCTSARCPEDPPQPSLGLDRSTSEPPCLLTLSPATGELSKWSEREENGVKNQVLSLHSHWQATWPCISQPPFWGYSTCALPSPLHVQLLQNPMHHMLLNGFSMSWSPVL